MRKKQEVAGTSVLVEEAVRKEEEKKRKRNNQEVAATPSPSTPAAAAAAAQILEVATEGAAARKVPRRGKLEQGQSGQLPSPVVVHPQGGEAATDGGIGGSNSAGRRRRRSKSPVLSKNELIKLRFKMAEKNPLPQGFFAPFANPNYTDQDPKHHSIHGPFFDQFRYQPKRQQGRNAPSLPKTPDPPARLPPRDHPPILSSQLTANKAFMVANQEVVATPSPSTPAAAAAAAHILEVAAEGAAVRKVPRWGKLEQGQSSQLPSPVDIHPQGREAATDGGVGGSNSVRRRSSSKPRALSNNELIRLKIKLAKEKPLPQGFFPPNANPNCTDHGAFFDQFRYQPERRQGRNAPSLPKTPDPPARLPPRDHPPILSSQLTANEAFLVANQEVVATPSPSTPAAAATVAHILEVAAEGAAARKVPRQGKLEQGQSGQLPSPVDIHPQGREAATDGGVGGSNSVRRRSSSKPGALSNNELIRLKIKLAKEKPLPQGFFPPNANPNCTDHGAFFDQFRYQPKRQQGHNAPSLPKTPDPPARLPPRDHPPILSSQLTANEAFMVAKTTTLNRKQPPSASGPKEEVKVKERKRPQKKMSGVEKPKKKSRMLSAAEKWSDVYRRVPLDQLVPALPSPHKLLQEKYAHDPWKVLIICMFLNSTRGGQVNKIFEGFFRCYPDAQTASTADLEKMAEHLAPMGFQNVKAKRIQKFSKGYVEEGWTHIPQLCGVGKYAADAYAIFCAGRATEVVPEDHKLVDYWEYVCPKLLEAKAKQNVPEAAGEAGELSP
ncbi:unnamed protein product [Urochloa humidicola]